MKGRVELKKIKFRAWSKQTNKMYTFEELEKMDVSGYLNFYTLVKGDYANYIPSQYTGLSDKNGKEIYEGDIVRYKQRNLEKAFGINDGGDDFVLKYRKIEFHDQSFNVPAGFIKELEVIGNIYETIEQEENQ